MTSKGYFGYFKAAGGYNIYKYTTYDAFVTIVDCRTIKSNVRPVPHNVLLAYIGST